jgi:hypothetical protein
MRTVFFLLLILSFVASEQQHPSLRRNLKGGGGNESSTGKKIRCNGKNGGSKGGKGKGGKSSKSPSSKGKGKDSKSSKSPSSKGKGSKSSKSPSSKGKGSKSSKSPTSKGKSYNGSTDGCIDCSSPEARNEDIVEIVTSISGDITTEAQRNALVWLTEKDVGSNTCEGESKIRGRYSLAVFYYSTGGAEWDISTNWLDPSTDECTWHGISCDSNGDITEIKLGKLAT